MVRKLLCAVMSDYRLAAGAFVLAAATALAVCPAAGAGPPPRSAAFADPHWLHCSIVDDATGQPMPARCVVKGADGYDVVPSDGGFYHSSHGGYFYSGGSFDAFVPKGRTVVRVGRGFEYYESAETLSVHADTSIVVRLSRVVDMAALGWFSGDSHVHIHHDGTTYLLSPADMHMIAQAEGLNVANCLDYDYYFTGAPASCSTADCIVYMSEEYRTNGEGHLGLIGIASLVNPANGLWWPMDFDVASRAHAAGGLVISAHPISSLDFWTVSSWPANGIARELPIDVIGGSIDAMDIMSYSNCRPAGIELPYWYRLLNCGFKLPASAGTDAAVDREDDLPAGGAKVYVFIPGGSFTYPSWSDGLAKGRTVVTNGPLVTHFDVAGLSPGDSVSYADGSHVVSGRIAVTSARPVNRIEIVRNGVAVRTIALSGPRRTSVDTTFDVPIDKSCWVAARVSGGASGWVTIGDTLFAHTSPMYFKVAGRRILELADAQPLVSWVRNLKKLGLMKGTWPVASDSTLFREVCDEAIDFYNQLILDPTDAGSSRKPPGVRVFNAPNPFSSSTALTFTMPADAQVRVTIYDVSGRIVRRLVRRPLGAGSYTVSWDGRDDAGARAASGVYFARVAAGAWGTTRKMLLVR
jgi:hypothetical protein